jgi:hypothetical protein
MNPPSTFIRQSNLTTLWEVICDQPMYQRLSKANQEQMRRIFYENGSAFYEREKKTPGETLMTLNKKYMLAILQHMKSLAAPMVTTRKIKIHEERLDDTAITIEEIQHKKLSEFEYGVEAQRKDLDAYMTPPRPPVPHFADPVEDVSLDIEEELRRITAQRNYEGQGQGQGQGQLQQSIKQSDQETRPVEDLAEDKKRVTWGENTDIYTMNELHQKITRLEDQLQQLQAKVELLRMN